MRKLKSILGGKEEMDKIMKMTMEELHSYQGVKSERLGLGEVTLIVAPGSTQEESGAFADFNELMVRFLGTVCLSVCTKRICRASAIVNESAKVGRNKAKARPKVNL